MLNIDIAKLAAVWGRAPLKINPWQCIPLRFPKSECRLCVENCPAQAIEIREDSISVFDDKCTGCGICFNICPTGVFEMTNFDYDSFSETAQEFIKRAGAVRIECNKVPFDSSTSRLPPPAPHQLRLPCLAHITPSLLLKLLSMGADKITIKDAGICEVCESRCGDRIARDVVSKIQGFLKDGELKDAICIATERISLNKLVFDGGRLKDYKDDPQMSRRQMFSMFKRETMKGVTGLVKGEAGLRIEKGKDGLKKILPKERGVLLKALAELTLKNSGIMKGNGVTNSRIFPTIAIKHGCDICQLCAIFCPTDALTVEETEKEQGILFIAAFCVDCSLCVEVCPKDAVAVGTEEIPLSAIIEQKQTSLVRFEKSFCAYCGRVFVKKMADDVCDVCLKEKEIW